MNTYSVSHIVKDNTIIVNGNGQARELTDLVPGILTQIGPDSLAQLRQMAEVYQKQATAAAAGSSGDDDVPDLV
jgi:nascent polypeptide-associated complex subunit beta